MSYIVGSPVTFGAPMHGSDAQDIAAANQRELGRIQTAPALLDVQNKQARFNQLFPFLKSQYGEFGSQNPYTIGGQTPQGPEISTNPVLNPQQIQQQVNSQTAANNQSTAAQAKQMQQSLAGRGFGANSPLAQALAGQMQSANLGANTANERETRLGAAQQNAGQVFNEQQARQAQFATQQQLDIARAQPYFQQRNVLLQALAGLV